MTASVQSGSAVVTGIGLKTPIGCDQDSFWRKLVSGQSAARGIDGWKNADGETYFACRVDEFEPSDYLSPREVRRTDRVTQLAWAAAVDALALAGNPSYAPERSAVIAASGIGGFGTMSEQQQVFIDSGMDRVTPFAIPMAMPNAPSAQISLGFGWRGPSMCISTACASGANAIGEGLRLLRDGSADIVIAGGSEAVVELFVLIGFDRARALSRRYSEPEAASRPFDAARDGFVLGEGAGFVILERPAAAQARGATVLGTILGYGRNSDSHHVTEPAPRGRGAADCMRLALADAALTPSDIVHINAHGSSTAFNDVAEAQAISDVFGEGGIPVTSNKGSFGHLVGAAGAVETIATLLALQHREIPPTANLAVLDPEVALDVVMGRPRSFAPGPCLSNSFGFGGHNAVLAIGPNESSPPH